MINTQRVSKKSPITRLFEDTKKEGSILVIEPHPAIAEVLASLLSLSEYDCFLMSSLDSVSPLWRDARIDTPPSGILLDVDIRSMALHHPFDVVHALYGQWQQAFFAVPLPPLLLLTTQPGDGAALQQAGYCVIMKPFQSSVLIRQIKTATEQIPQEGALQMQNICSWVKRESTESASSHSSRRCKQALSLLHSGGNMHETITWIEENQACHIMKIEERERMRSQMVMPSVREEVSG